MYLASSYLLAEDSDTGTYSAIRYRQRSIKSVPGKRNRKYYIHGPAFTRHATETDVSLDIVPCVRCLSWPPQAADWPTRHRNYDWPDSATVGRVVNNGCDAVQVAHRLCRQDEWMSEYQWRLSFSRAEIVLLNSWMPVQQIVYHMLRVFVKTERLTDITDSTGTKIISNYHFKTLTLWACELKPLSWWTDDTNVVRICVKLLHFLANWLKSKICPHYFINNCNLMYNTEQTETISGQLASITESWLSTWFVNNYLRKCAQFCPDRVSRLFDDVTTSAKLQNVVSALVDWRLSSTLNDWWRVRVESECFVPSCFCSKFLTVGSCRFWINELGKFDPCFRDYFTALAFLHAVKRIAKHSLNDVVEFIQLCGRKTK